MVLYITMAGARVFWGKLSFVTKKKDGIDRKYFPDVS